jgi:hypothetical protein
MFARTMLGLAFAFIYLTAGVCLAQESHPAGDTTELRAIIVDINRQIQAPSSNYDQAIAALKGDADRLTTALDAGTLGKTEALVAVFQRAMARAMIGQIQWRRGEKIDTAAAIRVVEDMDKVIASDVDASAWGINSAEAEYVAGSAAMLLLASPGRAYAYWEKCADQGHAGCLNNMANARFTGEGGLKVDIKQALDYHSRVFETGIKYRCAGAESARNIALIIYFTGVRRPDDDELEWSQKAYALLDKLQASGVATTCARFETEIEEFLYRLSRGERKESILQEAAGVGLGLGMGPMARKAVVAYLSGAETNEAFAAQAASAKDDFDFCGANLYGLWYSELVKNHSQGTRYRLALSRRDHKCSLQLLLAKKFIPPASTGPRPAAARPR